MIWRILLLIVGFRIALIIAKEEGKKREARIFLEMTGQRLEEESCKPSFLEKIYKENKGFICIICFIMLLGIGMISVGKGILKMREQTKIEEEGEKVNAKVINCEEKESHLELKYTEYHYLVEFNVGEKSMQGRMVSTSSTLRGDNVDMLA